MRGGRGEEEGSTEQNIFAVGESEGGVMMMEGWCRDQTFRELVLELYFRQTTAEIYADDMSLPKGI